MSLDRRIVSILYHNGIYDVDEVEKFIGEKNNYYEILIGGDIKKLEIPGNKYSKSSEINEENYILKIYDDLKDLGKDEIIVKENNIENFKKDEIKNKNEEDLNSYSDLKDLGKDEVEEKSFEEELEKNEIENEKFLEKVNDIFEQKSFEEVVEVMKDNKIITADVYHIPVSKIEKDEIKKEVKKPKISNRKLKIVESKKIDDDLNDFINTI